MLGGKRPFDLVDELWTESVISVKPVDYPTTTYEDMERLGSEYDQSLFNIR